MSVSHNHNNSGYDVYRCDGCGCSGRSPMDAGLPDGWTQTFIMGNYLCPRCSVKREEKSRTKSSIEQCTIWEKSQERLWLPIHRLSRFITFTQILW